MWVVELKVWKEKSAGVRKTGELDVIAASYYLNVFRKGKKGHVAKVLVVKGPDKERFKEFFQAYGKVKVKAIEGDQIFYEHKSFDALNTRVADENVFFIKPIIAKGGFEYWTIASWSKAKLSNFIRKVCKLKGVKVDVLSLRQKNVDIFLSSALTRLTKKQLSALSKAVQSGYYDFPRKKTLEEVAHTQGVDESTFREHLRKAEGEIMKAVFEQIFG